MPCKRRPTGGTIGPTTQQGQINGCFVVNVDLSCFDKTRHQNLKALAKPTGSSSPHVDRGRGEPRRLGRPQYPASGTFVRSHEVESAIHRITSHKEPSPEGFELLWLAVRCSSVALLLSTNTGLSVMKMYVTCDDGPLREGPPMPCMFLHCDNWVRCRVLALFICFVCQS